MKVTIKNKTTKFQQGGAVPPAEAPAQATPEQGAGQDPIMMLAEMSAQALQNQDCQMALQVCQVFMEIVAQMQGGAQQELQGEPVFKKGGTLIRRIKK